MQFKLQRVEFMPGELEAGVLYYSSEYEAAAHLCACGCGSKIRTPIAPTEWSIKEGKNGPTLWPSVGNWQQPCRSHYFISNGGVEWASQWSDARVAAGRANEEMRRAKYYANLEQAKRSNPIQTLWALIASTFSKVFQK